MLSLNKHYNLGTLTDAQVDENWDDISGEVNSLLSRLPQNNYSATTDPTVNDDVTQGYSTGSLWYNRTTDTAFILTNASSGAANWVERDSISAADLGSAAFADILGTVSQSGGVPTGALMEYGSNANGEYWKYAGGMMLMRRAAEVDVTSTSIQSFDYPATPQWASGAGITAGYGMASGNMNSALYNTNIQRFGGASSAWFVRLSSSGTSSDPSSIDEKLMLSALTRWFS